MPRVHRGLGAALLALWVSTSCVLPSAAVDEGGGGGGASGGGSGGGAGCGAKYSNDAVCEACATKSCCNQLKACAPGTPCSSLLDCITANCPTGSPPTCGTDSCSAFMSAVSTATAMFDCVCAACTAACGSC